MSETRPHRLRAALEIAASYLQGETAGTISARAIGDYVNSRLAEEPSTTGWHVTRLEIEAALQHDPRFTREDGRWRRAERASAEVERSATRSDIDPLQPGADLALYAWQNEALLAWRTAHRRGIVEAVTGSGKTRVGQAAMAEHLRDVSARAVVLVPTIDLAHQWLRGLHSLFAVPVSIVGGGSTDDFSKYSILVFVARTATDELPAQMRRLAATRDVLLVADECHRYGTATYARALDGPFSATLGLSATPERATDDGMAQFVVPSIGNIVYAYGHDRGIGEAVVADFRICFAGVDFQTPEREEHDALSRRLERAHKSLLGAFPFLVDARPFIGAVRRLATQDEEGLARGYLRLAGERGRLLHGARGRNDLVFRLAERGAFGGRRSLFFHESIADCERLAQGLVDAGMSAAAHHSELDRERRRSTLAAFARGELDAIAAPRTLDEGIDVPDASLAVIVAGTSVKRQTIQRIGRVLRRTPDKGTAKVMKVFVNGAADDPSIPGTATFARDLATSPRGTIRRWPGEAEDILRFLVEM